MATSRLDDDLLSRLRRTTAPSHERLEAKLDLLRRPLDRRRFLDVLQGFHGFHAVWEQAMAETLLADFAAPRRRLPAIEADLRALGMTADEIHALPRCEAAADLCASTAAGLGSMYVIEGSALGGQLIGRALSEADWLPEGGLSYFNPYGKRTGEMWRSYRSFAESVAAPGEAVAAGAVRTFDLLTDWLVRS